MPADGKREKTADDWLADLELQWRKVNNLQRQWEAADRTMTEMLADAFQTGSVSYRAMGRVTGLEHTTIMYRVKKAVSGSTGRSKTG